MPVDCWILSLADLQSISEAFVPIGGATVLDIFDVSTVVVLSWSLGTSPHTTSRARGMGIAPKAIVTLPAFNSEMELELDISGAIDPFTWRYSNISSRYVPVVVLTGDAKVVLRLPVLEIYNLASSNQHQLRLGAHDTLSQLVLSDETWKPYHPVCDSMQLLYIPKASWVWFIILTGKTDQSLWMSTNSFLNLGPANVGVVELKAVHKNDVFDPSNELETAGKCDTGTMIVSIGDILVTSNTWGVSWKAIDGMNIYDKELMHSNWTLVFPYCARIVPDLSTDAVTKTHKLFLIPSELGATTGYTNTSMVVRLPSVFVLEVGEELVLTELVDKEQRSLAATATIVSLVALKAKGRNSYTILVYSEGRYSLVELVDQVWTTIFEFNLESSLPIYFDASQDEMVLKPFNFQGLSTPPSISLHLYCFGNALMMSDNGGRSFNQVQPKRFDKKLFIQTPPLFSRDPITTLVHSSHGWIAVLTNSSNIFIGRNGAKVIFPFLVEEENARGQGFEAPISIFFDESDKLFLVGTQVNDDGLKTLQSAKILDYSGFQSSFKTLVNEATCQVEKLLFQCTHASNYTRIDAADNKVFNTLPSMLFLRKGDAYSFQIKLYAKGSLNHLHLFFEISNSLIRLEVQRNEILMGHFVEYNITLYDQGKWLPGAGIPGEQMEISKLRIKNGVRGCESPLDEAAIMTRDRVIAPVEVNVYSGCPPGYEIQFDASLTTDGINHGCTRGNEDLCFFYQFSPFQPQFKLINKVTGVESLYAGARSLAIIGGGRTYEEIQMYSQEEVELFTPLVISPIDGALHTYQWGCVNRMSPCYMTFPWTSATYVPQYFFVMEMTNEQNDYCYLKDRFIVRVHNLPITIETILLMNIISIALLVAPVGYMYFKKQQSLKLNRMLGLESVDISKLNFENDSDDDCSDTASVYSAFTVD